MNKKQKRNWTYVFVAMIAVAALIVSTTVLLPSYAVDYSTRSEEKTSTEYFNETTNATLYDPETGLPTTIVNSGRNYHFDMDYDREYIIDAYSKYATTDGDYFRRAGEFSLYPRRIPGGTAPVITDDNIPSHEEANIAIRATEWADNETLGSPISGVLFDVGICQEGGNNAVNAVIIGGLAAALVVGIAIAAAPATAGTSLVALGVVGFGIGAAAGWSGTQPAYDTVLQARTDSDGWAKIDWDETGALAPGAPEFDAYISLNITNNYLGFAQDEVVIQGTSRKLLDSEADQAVFLAYLVRGNEDSIVAAKAQEYRTETNEPKKDAESTYSGPFQADGTVTVHDTSTDDDYDSRYSQYVGGEYVNDLAVNRNPFLEVQSKRKITLPSPEPANFDWVMNVTYSPSDMVAPHDASLTLISGSTYVVEWEWTVTRTLPLVYIYPQVRYTTDGWATETALWAGNESFTPDYEALKVRWGHSWNDPKGNDMHRFSHLNELRPNCIYDIQTPFYQENATNTTYPITVKMFVSSDLSNSTYMQSANNYAETTYGRQFYETDGEIILWIRDYNETYIYSDSTYNLEGTQLLKKTWYLPLSGNMTGETSYGIDIIMNPYDFLTYDYDNANGVFARTLYYFLSDWLEHRQDVQNLQELLDQHFPLNVTEFSTGYLTPLDTLLDTMAVKIRMLEQNIDILESKYGENNASAYVREEIEMYKEMYYQIDIILEKGYDIEWWKENPNEYSDLRTRAYICLESYQGAFTYYSAYVSYLKGEYDIGDDIVELVERWYVTHVEKYEYIMAKVNKDFLRTIALLISMFTMAAILLPIHFLGVAKSKYWKRSKKWRYGIIISYVLIFGVGTWLLFTFVYLPILENAYIAKLG